MKTPEQLKQAAEIANRDGAHQLSIRELLQWYGYARRGSWISSKIRQQMRRLKVKTVPDWEEVWIDIPVSMIPLKAEVEPPKLDDGVKPDGDGDNEVKVTHAVAPSHRISRLEAASRLPLTVKPIDSISIAVTHMMSHGYSQLPVMTNPGTVRGMVSWRSIGQQLTLGQKCDQVAQCLEPHYEVPATASMFDVIRQVAKHDCVLVRVDNGTISGIVTAADISEQFRKLSEPFLLLGDVENNLRRLVDGKYSAAELAAICDPKDWQRKIESASDLTFGEYVRLLENPTNWEKLGLLLDRVVFKKQLDDVRQIRNDVMHFDPDGIAEDQLERLRRFGSFLEKTVSLLQS